MAISVLAVRAVRAVEIVKLVIWYALAFYLLLLVGRLIFSWIQVFSRSWTPRGPVLVIAETVYTATDPPLRFLSRFIPVLRIGAMGLDLSFMVLFFIIIVLLNWVVPLL